MHVDNQIYSLQWENVKLIINNNGFNETHLHALIKIFNRRGWGENSIDTRKQTGRENTGISAPKSSFYNMCHFCNHNVRLFLLVTMIA